MSDERIGKVIDDMGVTLDLTSTQRLASVLIIGKVIDLKDGGSYLVIGSNQLDWIEIDGLLKAMDRVQSAQTLLRLSNACECSCDEGDSDNGA